MDVCSTILAACWFRQHNSHLPWNFELENSLERSRVLELGKAPLLSSPPTVVETRQLFAALGVPLTDHFKDSDVVSIVRAALSRIDPYEGRVPATATSVG